MHLVFGRADGVDTSSSIILPHDASGLNLDHFGATLALVTRCDAIAGNVHDLYVGCPAGDCRWTRAGR